MKLITIPLLLSLVALTAPVHADELEGTVLAYDRQAKVIVMQDKSVIPLANLKGELPPDLVSGDRIAVSYESNEDDGIHTVHSVTRM